MTTAPLPGIEPGFVTIRIVREADGYFRLRWLAAESEGLARADQAQLYTDLTHLELVDVLDALLTSAGM